MGIPVRAYGFNLANLFTTAMGKTVGTQAADLCAAVSTAIGTNSILRIKVEGVEKYKAVIAGTLSSSAAGVALPATFNAPSTNVADLLTGDNCVLTVSNATNGTIYLEISLGQGAFNGTSRKLMATSTLDGAAALKAGAVLFKPSTILDFVARSSVTPSAGVSATSAMILQDMSGDNDVLAVPKSGFALGSRKATIWVPSYDALVDMTLNSKGTLASSVNALVPLTYVFEANSNTATNTKVLVRDIEAFVLRKSDSVWKRLGGPDRPWGRIVAAASGVGSQGNLAMEEDWRSASCTPINNAYELRPENFFNFNYRDLIIDAKAFHVRAQMRLDLIDPTVADDRANARYYGAQAFDLYSTSNGTTERPPNFYPNRAMDGGNGKYKMVPFDSGTLTSELWTMFSCTSTTSFSDALTPVPWPNAGVNAWPYDTGTWIISDTDFNANLPPLP